MRFSYLSDVNGEILQWAQPRRFAIGRSPTTEKVQVPDISLFKSDCHSLKSRAIPHAFPAKHLSRRKIAGWRNFDGKYTLENSTGVEEPGHQAQRLNCAHPNAMGMSPSFLAMPRRATSQQTEDRENQQSLEMGQSFAASSHRVNVLAGVGEASSGIAM
jgi:hypothetical protein